MKDEVKFEKIENGLIITVSYECKDPEEVKPNIIETTTYVLEDQDDDTSFSFKAKAVDSFLYHLFHEDIFSDKYDKENVFFGRMPGYDYMGEIDDDYYEELVELRDTLTRTINNLENTKLLKKRKKNVHSGSSFDEFLKEEGIKLKTKKKKKR